MKRQAGLSSLWYMHVYILCTSLCSERCLSVVIKVALSSQSVSSSGALPYHHISIISWAKATRATKTLTAARRKTGEKRAALWRGGGGGGATPGNNGMHVACGSGWFCQDALSGFLWMEEKEKPVLCGGILILCTGRKKKTGSVLSPGKALVGVLLVGVVLGDQW